MVLKANEPIPQPPSPYGSSTGLHAVPISPLRWPPAQLGTVAALVSALLAACAAPGSALAPVAPPPPVAAPAPPPVEAPPPAPAPTPAEPAPEAKAVPVQRLVVNALELLEAGNEEQASAELQRALQQEPNHRLAQSLLKQIAGDPAAQLGRESFPYRVQPGETLSRIAQRFLGDPYLFYILARYNDIKVPRQLAGGQTIRVPGKAPPPGAAPAQARSPAPASPVVPVGQPPAAGAPAAQPVAAGPAAEAPKAAAPVDRSQAILRSTRAARAALARQDLAGAIRHWDAVLELDPDNTTAKLERQKVRDLRDRLNKVK